MTEVSSEQLILLNFILPTCRLFGKSGSAYDFNDPSVDMKKMAEKARELEESQKGMSKKVNPKVVNMIDRYGIRTPRRINLS